MSWKSLWKFLKEIIAGIIGAAILFMTCVFAFAIIKLYYIASGRYLLLSKYTIMIASAILMLLGFILGVRAFRKRNNNYKLFKPTWINFLLNFIIAAILAFGSFLILKYRFLFLLSYRSLILLFIVMFILFYTFSAVFSTFITGSKRSMKQHKARNIILFILFNPFFIMVYLWLFGSVVYNSFYVPCTVSIVGIEKSQFTTDTQSLGIQPGEKIISIDGTPIKTLADVKSYLNNLSSTKEVMLETEKNIYYVKTYMKDNSRYMGLILGQDYCARKY
jgi:hypothetical protein